MLLWELAFIVLVEFRVSSPHSSVPPGRVLHEKSIIPDNEILKILKGVGAFARGLIGMMLGVSPDASPVGADCVVN
jgi:hypothetical protein